MTIASISATQLIELHKATPVDLVDVRTPMEFREVHVAFARNVPLDRIDPAAIMSSRNGSADQPLYLICRSGGRGTKACELFIGAGFENVINVDGGTMACEQAGLPVNRGKKAVSLERQVRILAGFIVLVGSILGFINPVLCVVPGFVGAGLMFAGITDSCAMGMLMAKMPWNNTKKSCAT